MSAEPGTQLLKASADAIGTAARGLAAGGLVAFPTETVYGLGADAGNGEAVARLYAAKGRPRFNPLISHITGLAAAERLATFNAPARRLAEAFWPGPLTLVLPKSPDCGVSDLALAGLDSIAIRVPAHPVARDLLAAFGGPIVAPSANRSGHVSPTDAAHVMADLRGLIDVIVDGGPCAVGVESTIVSLVDTPTLLRPGGLPREDIERVLGAPLADAPASETLQAPGMLASHYAPKTQVRLDANETKPGEVLLGFGPKAPADALNLSPRGDLVEAAVNLFSHLRILDRAGARMIAVMSVPRHGLGEAINDRLRRAAAPRPGQET
jgi:L-threonylcarbamoyladenylate synthase